MSGARGDAETRSFLAGILATYKHAVSALNEYRATHYAAGQFVRVNDERFRGVGIVSPFSSDVPPHVLPVLLENGNTWWYPLESIVSIVPANQVPRAIRRMKLRWHGYKLTGCIR